MDAKKSIERKCGAERYISMVATAQGDLWLLCPSAGMLLGLVPVVLGAHDPRQPKPPRRLLQHIRSAKLHNLRLLQKLDTCQCPVLFDPVKPSLQDAHSGFQVQAHASWAPHHQGVSLFGHFRPSFQLQSCDIPAHF